MKKLEGATIKDFEIEFREMSEYYYLPIEFLQLPTRPFNALNKKKYE